MDYDVLLVSKYLPIRAGERQVLETRGKIPADKIYEADSKDQALKTLEAVINSGGTVGVVVTDLRFGRDENVGVQLLKAIKTKYASVPVIITSGEDSPSGKIEDPEEDPAVVADAVLSQGAFAYYHKSRPIQDLVDEVATALGRRT